MQPSTLWRYSRHLQCWGQRRGTVPYAYPAEGPSRASAPPRRRPTGCPPWTRHEHRLAGSPRCQADTTGRLRMAKDDGGADGPLVEFVQLLNPDGERVDHPEYG